MNIHDTYAYLRGIRGVIDGLSAPAWAPSSNICRRITWALPHLCTEGALIQVAPSPALGKVMSPPCDPPAMRQHNWQQELILLVRPTQQHPGSNFWVRRGGKLRRPVLSSFLYQVFYLFRDPRQELYLPGTHSMDSR